VFAISVCSAIILVLKRVNIALAVTTAFLLYSIPLLGVNAFNVVVESFNATMLNTVLSLTFAMVLANLYRNTKASREMVDSFESLGWRTASIGVPAAIGLLPMPAGAYVSATMIDPTYSKAGFNGVEKTFLNYWFRHIWVSTWPLYQNIILASAVLGLSYGELFARTWVVMVSSAISGTVLFTYISRGRAVSPGGSRGLKGLIHLWPFPLIALLSIYLNLPLYTALLIVVSLFLMLYRPDAGVINRPLRSLSTRH
jgi:integral membrane protein (TIGR00529 family)